MPLGFERVNERQQRPNALINFIKPLETAHKATSEKFLQRIAAQCYPVMKKHHMAVMSLEEYPPNPEFLGRNFNAGEVIQLVLKDRQGRWLSLKFVQMVMMHELAHCKQMNHSRFFWNVRNEYAKQMEGLWQDGYLGEGMWGRGRGLEDGVFVHDHAPDSSQVPEHLCGGSYRRRGRKRKRGSKDGDAQRETLSYAERQQRRIARKFGKHGEGAALGEDELVRGALESMNKGRSQQGKPKVAKSKRGRELRASAALARLEAAKRQTLDQHIKKEEDSDTESDWDEHITYDGPLIKDEQGHDLVKVCEDEGENDQERSGQEMNELRQLGLQTTQPVSLPDQKPSSRPLENQEDSETESDPEEEPQPLVPEPLGDTAVLSTRSSPKVPIDHRLNPIKAEPSIAPTASNSQRKPIPVQPLECVTCPICSLENEPGSPTCVACSHVIRPNLIPNCWRCQSETCRGTKYMNAGDAGVCGLCGATKPKTEMKKEKGGSKSSLGLTSPEVLRWD